MSFLRSRYFCWSLKCYGRIDSSVRDCYVHCEKCLKIIASIHHWCESFASRCSEPFAWLADFQTGFRSLPHPMYRFEKINFFRQTFRKPENDYNKNQIFNFYASKGESQISRYTCWHTNSAELIYHNKRMLTKMQTRCVCVWVCVCECLGVCVFGYVCV